MDSKQFAWLYVIEHGTPGRKRGMEVLDDVLLDVKIDNPRAWNASLEICAIYLDRIKRIGVNWDKTNAPTSDYYSEFNGTFNNPSDKEGLSGTLVLNDGTKQIWFADCEVTNVFDMMAEVEQVKDKFNSLFVC